MADGQADDAIATDSSAWPRSIEDLIESWSRRVGAVEAGHYIMADRLGRANVRLGVPVVILSGLIGTSVFATLQTRSTIASGSWSGS